MVSISIYPPPLRKYAPLGVPPAVAADMTEALGCFADEYWVASAVVGRRALERAVEGKLTALPDVKPRSRDLVDQIDALPDSVLPVQWRQAAHQVRLIGNDGAHPDVVTQDDARSLLEFAEGVFHQMFTMPERLKAATETRPIPPPRPPKK